ncbi:uncharacterized protein A4U43_C05F10750 [Asparagus officinalis]|uniref:Uncharacterized protein n=1 Tax=Asparagus officinalis TaxID=4686 RepID=A0A5P1ERT7_ASPOF|nr:uncharacterized protein A4U43_C05F10750 [Asparagus officinalis]
MSPREAGGGLLAAARGLKKRRTAAAVTMKIERRIISHEKKRPRRSDGPDSLAETLAKWKELNRQNDTSKYGRKPTRKWMEEFWHRLKVKEYGNPESLS